MNKICCLCLSLSRKNSNTAHNNNTVIITVTTCGTVLDLELLKLHSFHERQNVVSAFIIMNHFN